MHIPDWLTAIGTMGATLAALGIALKNWKSETEKEKRARQPHLTLCCKETEKDKDTELEGLRLWIKNIGFGPAFNISIKIKDNEPQYEVPDLGYKQEYEIDFRREDRHLEDDFYAVIEYEDVYGEMYQASIRGKTRKINKISKRTLFKSKGEAETPHIA